MSHANDRSDKGQEYIERLNKIYEKLDRIDDEVKDMRRNYESIEKSISSSQGHLDKLNDIDARTQHLTFINERSNNIDQNISQLKQKVPNLISILGVITVVLGFFGYSNIRQMQDEFSNQVQEEVKELAQTINEERDNLVKTSDSLREKIVSVAEAISDLDPENLQRFRNEIEVLSTLIEEQNRKVESIDEGLAIIASNTGMMGSSSNSMAESISVGNSKDKSTVLPSVLAERYKTDPAWGPYFKGKLYLSNNELMLARQSFSKGLKYIGEKDKDLFYEAIGETFYREKQYKQAIAKFREGLSLNPKNHWTVNYLGNSYYRLAIQEPATANFKKYLQYALEFYEQAYALSQNPVYLSNQALMYSELGEIDKSTELLKAYDGDPSPVIYIQLSENYALRNDKVAAINFLRKSMELDKGGSYLSEILTKKAYRNLHGDQAFVNLITQYGGKESVIFLESYWRNLQVSEGEPSELDSSVQ